MQPGTRRTLRWVLAIAAVVLLAAVAVAATLAAQLSGGWDEVLDWTHPTASDPEVVAARTQAGAEADAAMERLVGDVVLPALVGGRVVTPALSGTAAQQDETLGSGCEEGQHDWKRDDPFDLACIEVRRTIVAADSADVRSQLVALDAALQAEGCQSDANSGLQFTIDYWDQFGGSPSGGSDGIYGPEDLPGARCRSSDGDEVRVELRPLGGEAPPAPADGEFLLTIEYWTQSFLA